MILVCVRQNVIGAESQFHFHVPAGFGGDLANEGLETPAVGNRLVEPPATTAHAQCRGSFADQSQRGHGFRQFAIAAVDAGNVPATTIAAQAAQSRRPARFRGWSGRCSRRARVHCPEAGRARRGVFGGVERLRGSRRDGRQPCVGGW